MSVRVRRASRLRQAKDAKNVGSSFSIQPKVTSFFPTIRRGKSVGKRMKIEVSVPANEFTKQESWEVPLVPLNEEQVSFDFAKMIPKSITGYEPNIDDTNIVPVSSVLKNKYEDKCDSVSESGCSTANTEKVEKKSAKRRLLFSDEEHLSPVKDVSAKTADTDITFIKSRIVKHVKKEKNREAKTVAELQEQLASKGIGASLYNQNLSYKSTKVADRKAELLSPRKTVLVPLKSKGSPIKPVKVFETPRKMPIKLSEKLQADSVSPSKKSDGLNYGRASLLKQEVKNSCLLLLPKKHERLHKFFESVDQVVSIYQARDMRIPLNLVISNITSSSKKTCTVKDFSQLVFIYPAAYNVRVEECKVQKTGFEGRFEYVIEPNFADDIRDYMEKEIPEVKPSSPIKLPPFTSPCKGRIVPSPRKTPVKVQPLPRDPVLDLRPRLEGWRRIVRTCVFKHRLVKFIHENNPELANKLRNSAEVVEGSEISVHVEISDDLFADVPEGSLPELPKGDESLQKNAKDYLSGVQDSYNTLPGNLQDAINLLRSPQSKTVCVMGREIPLSPRKYAAESAGKSKGLSLLERVCYDFSVLTVRVLSIRAKEVEKKRLLALRDPEKERKRRRLQELLVYIRDLCRLFTFSRVNSLPLSKLSQKLVDGSARSSKNEVEAQIMLLTTVAEQYFELRVVADVKYIFIKQNSPLEILALLNNELKKCS
uniref:CDT1 domain-containing protein n=1 Tax=Syphacia muris TaxID=451379 RepID=A0A0N5A964_9BILA